GRMLEQRPLLATLLWGAILAATTEELLFRGVFWSLVERAVEAARARVAKAPTPAGQAKGRKLEAGLLGLGPTTVTAARVGLMHGELHGGVGIVRLVSATLLGVGAGALRRWTGTLAAPTLLHFLNNTMVIGQVRRLFTGDPMAPAVIDGVP